MHGVLDVGTAGMLLTLVAREVYKWSSERRNGDGNGSLKIAVAKIEVQLENVLDRLGRIERRLDKD